MGEVEKLKSIATRALDAADKTKSKAKKEEYLKIAEEAIKKAKAYKAEYASAAEATSPAMGPYQGVAKPSVMAQFGMPEVNATAGIPEQLIPEMAMPMAAGAGGLDMSFLQGEQSLGDAGAVGQAATDIGEAAVRNASVSGAVGGAIAGGAFGGIPGAVLGGAVGTFGGELVEDAYEGVPLSYQNAVNSAALSVGLDLATLGGAKILGPFIKRAYQAGKKPVEVIKELAAKPTPAPMGSQQSLAQTQQTLVRAGQTLTAAEVPNGSGIVKWMDAFSRDAVSTRGMVAQRKIALEGVVKAEYDKLFTGDVGRQMSADEIGQMTYQIINKGKSALGANYAAALDGVKTTLRGKFVNTQPIKDTMSRFLKRYEKSYGSDLNPATVKFIKEQMETLPPNMKAVELLDFEKRMGGLINEMGTFGSQVYNGSAAFQLGDMSSQFRDAVGRQMFRLDPEAAKLYGAAKNTYAQGLSDILPDINKSVVKAAAERGDFQSLGRIVTQVNNVDRTISMMSSIRSSFAQLKRDGVTDLAVQNADEAISALREGYMSHLFKSTSDEATGIMDMGSLAKKFDDPKYARQLEAVMGDQAASVKRFMNLIHDVTKKPESPAGTLVLRGLEASSVAGVGIAAVSGVGLPTALGAAAAVFGSPMLMQKIARNPKLVNRVIALSNNPRIKTAEQMAVAFNDLVSNEGLLEEE